MMTNGHNISNLKRRRPYDHGGSHVERDPNASPPHDLPSPHDPSLYPADRQYILEQAARILSVSVSQLLQVGQTRQQPSAVEQAAATLEVPVASLLELSQQHRPKRPRGDSTVPMPPTFPPRLVGQNHDDRGDDERFYGRQASQMDAYRGLTETPQSAVSLLGLGSSSIADCFPTFAACNPCTDYEPQDESYPPMTTARPYEYNGDGRLVVVDANPTTATLSPINSPEYQAFATSAAEVSGLLGCDDSSLLGGYLPHYPALPPSRPVGAEQSPTVGEIMFYPEHAQGVAYSRPVSGPPHLASVPLQPVSRVVEHHPHFVPSSMASEAPSPAHGSLAVMGGIGSQYGLQPSYGPAAMVVGDRSASAMDVYRRAPEVEVTFSGQRAPPAKRGPFKDKEDRQKTAYTRKIGSCIRCRMQRIRCLTDPADERGQCGTCKGVANTNKVWRLPCLRLKINDVVLSKTGPVKGYEWTRRWKEGMVAEDISSWASSEIKTIRVTEGFTGHPVELHVRQFVPQEGDSLERSWVSGGVKRSVKIPPFALVDMDAAKASYDEYIKNGFAECCDKLLNKEKKLLWLTYSQAMLMLKDPGMDREEKQLLASTLELWTSIRLTTTSFEIVGEETLGMTRDLMDETSPLCGRIPLPPVLGAQLDSILIHKIQAKFRHHTLDLLQKLTQENKQKRWLTTYLVTFVLLHNIALVIKHDASYARKHGIQRRFAREDKVKEYYTGAITLLAYFHYRGGNKVFASDFKDDSLRAHSGDAAADFVVFMRKYANDHEAEWRDLLASGKVEDECYFVAQMYEQNWLPRSWPA